MSISSTNKNAHPELSLNPGQRHESLFRNSQGEESISGDIPYWVAISRIEKMGAVRFKRLYSFFGSMKEAWEAPFLKLVAAGIERGVAHEFIEHQKNNDPEKELELLEKHGVCAITIKDKNYPPLLKEIYNPPALLYVRGNLKNLNPAHPLAIVGTRSMSSYGERVLQDIVSALAEKGITIISGLAIGVDARAHREAVESNGKTVAVLGSGVDDRCILPRSNFKLGQQILENNGTIISEYPIGVTPQAFHFPVRNRIISGLSKGVLIIEAAKKSGALITAYTAIEQNREVFAIPGSVYGTLSVGTNELIKKGAQVVSSADDIINYFGLEGKPTPQMSAEGGSASGRKALPANEEEEKILNLPFLEPLHINEIIKATKLSSSVTASTLSIMELQQKIKHLGGQTYTKI